jgi:transaldolase/glucose-6-phosphate isomerase
MNIKDLHERYGQSVWLDYIRRTLLESGELARLVKEDGIRGVTSNPSIFEKAIAESSEYAAALQRFPTHSGASAQDVYESLAVEDLQRAADVLRPVYDSSEGRDGYVSMEVSPYLAHDGKATIAEAARLWSRLQRDNVMIKVPGTPEGIPAIRELIGRGINVNVTLLFSRATCREANEAYMAGLEALVARGDDPRRVASVASMFVSRLDVLVDPMLEARKSLRGLVGRVAIANAKLAYQDWKEACRSDRWRALAARGARPQRLLWASTSTKDPRASDVVYVESLVGPQTVDTIPPKTLDAFRDHGRARDCLEENLDDAERTMAALAHGGISIDELTARLLDEGVAKFAASFKKLLGSIDDKRGRVHALHSAT